MLTNKWYRGSYGVLISRVQSPVILKKSSGSLMKENPQVLLPSGRAHRSGHAPLSGISCQGSAQTGETEAPVEYCFNKDYFCHGVTL